MHLRARIAIVAAALAVGSAAATGCDRRPPRVERDVVTIGPAGAAWLGRDPYSNVRPGDYVGPDACGDCHEDKHARWRQSLHAAMNRRADEPGAVIGDFDDAGLAYGGGIARFTRDGGSYVMSLAPARGPVRRFRVTRTIGARYLQEYVGVEVGDPRAVEIRLPFGWWPRAGGWMPRPYFDSWYGGEYTADGALAIDPYAPDREPWATRCAWCHNTYPFEIRLARAGARDVGHGLEQWFTLGGEPRPDRDAIARDNLLPASELVTVGISCESCHLGGRAHATAARPREVAPRFVPASPQLAARAGAPDLRGGRRNPVVVDAICAQCHSTPSPRYPNGAAVRNSTEALDLLASACASGGPGAGARERAGDGDGDGRRGAVTATWQSMPKCTDCHDPHTAGPGPGAPDAPRALAACTHCHAALAAPAAARAHARHDASVTCLDCHMPRIVAGVSAFVRTHRISSPADPVMLAAAAPSACNLCHLDRSITWTLAALADGWGVRLTPDAAWRAAYDGRLDASLGPAWLASPSGQIRITAAAAYARAPAAIGRAALPALAVLLADPVAYDRMWSLFAIEDILGRRLTPAEYDPLADQALHAMQADALRAAWSAPAPAAP